MLRCLPTSTPEKRSGFTVKVHFIGLVPNHSNFQGHSPHKTVCFEQSYLFCAERPSAALLVTGFIKEPLLLKWSSLTHLVFIETLCCVWAVNGYDTRAMFLLPNQRERCNTWGRMCSCRDGPVTVFGTLTNFVRKSNAHTGWVALRERNWPHWWGRRMCDGSSCLFRFSLKNWTNQKFSCSSLV